MVFGYYARSASHTKRALWPQCAIRIDWGQPGRMGLRRPTTSGRLCKSSSNRGRSLSRADALREAADALSSRLTGLSTFGAACACRRGEAKRFLSRLREMVEGEGVKARQSQR